MKILTWHVHGNYLLYLTRFSPHEFYLPTAQNGDGGRGRTMPFGDNVKEIAIEAVRNAEFDCILYQHSRNWLEDQHRILSDEQKRVLPKIFLEHDPPRENPVEQLHFVAAEKNVLLVHCTHFNALMWNAGKAVAQTIEHGVFLIHEARATYRLNKGVTAINNLATRARRAGGDLWTKAKEAGIELDLVGMNAQDAGGIGEIEPPQLPEFISHYRYYFNASRYTSLNLAMIEAMMVGLPIVAMATTEAAATVQNNFNGFADTNFEFLILRMRELAKDANLARTLGENAARYARERFDINRFTNDWNRAFAFVTGKQS